MSANLPPILLVEDDHINSLVAITQLNMLGYEVEHVSNGSDAVVQAKSGRFPIIIMDMRMEGMDGAETARQIREHERLCGAQPAYIICITANAMPGDREVCLKAGMNDYLPKPYQFEVLEEKLAVILHHAS